MEKKEKISFSPIVRNTNSKIVIAHGTSPVWKDLRHFLYNRLGLNVEEFNSKPVAGLTVQERLDEMKESACFAFFVLTGDNNHKDGTFHARDNVLHEMGIFQNELGQKKSIILLEDGCEEPTNIAGTQQIRFPKGNIMAVSEEIRKVLEREELIL